MLCGYHAFLVAANQTTYEHVRGNYDEPGSNPFDRGFLTNCAEDKAADTYVNVPEGGGLEV